MHEWVRGRSSQFPLLRGFHPLSFQQDMSQKTTVQYTIAGLLNRHSGSQLKFVSLLVRSGIVWILGVGCTKYEVSLEVTIGLGQMLGNHP